MQRHHRDRISPCVVVLGGPLLRQCLREWSAGKSSSWCGPALFRLPYNSVPTTVGRIQCRELSHFCFLIVMSRKKISLGEQASD